MIGRKMNIPHLKTNTCPMTLMRGMSSGASSKSKKNHYDTLKVSSNATQEEIKASYYNLSKQYHPDMNKDADANQKFRDVSEAYETLGNYKIRRQYDRGMTARGMNVKHDDKHDEQNIEHMEFYKSRMRNYPKPVQTANSKMYNFDEWTRAHYGDTLRRTVLRKQRNSDFQENLMRARDTNYGAHQISLLIGTTLLIGIALALTVTQKNYDEPLKRDSDNGKR